MSTPPTADTEQVSGPRIIDAHVHVWTPARARQARHRKAPPVLYSPYSMDDLRRAAGPALAGAVIVEADRDNDQENQDLADLASNDSLMATVGRLDPHADDFAEQLRRTSNDPSFRGIRYSLRPDQDGAWTTAAAANARRLPASGQLLEIMAPPNQLAEVALVAASVRETTVVVDHLAYVPPDRDIKVWASALASLASLPNVVGKLSHFRLPVSDIDLTRIRHVVDTFGPHRLMFGSNWPVCLRFGEYSDVVKIARVVCEPLTAKDRESIMYGTPARVFGIGGTIKPFGDYSEERY